MKIESWPERYAIHGVEYKFETSKIASGQNFWLKRKRILRKRTQRSLSIIVRTLTLRALHCWHPALDFLWWSRGACFRGSPSPGSHPTKVTSFTPAVSVPLFGAASESRLASDMWTWLRGGLTMELCWCNWVELKWKLVSELLRPADKVGGYLALAYWLLYAPNGAPALTPAILSAEIYFCKPPDFGILSGLGSRIITSAFQILLDEWQLV